MHVLYMLQIITKCMYINYVLDIPYSHASQETLDKQDQEENMGQKEIKETLEQEETLVIGDLED